MDKREEARLNMARSVSTLLARPEIVTAVAGTPAIGIAATELTDGIALIENLDTEANAAARGDGGSKTGLRRLALNTALIVDGKITAWAARRDLPEVINLFNHERTDLARLGDEDFRTVVARILAKARELDTPPKQATEEGLTTGHVTPWSRGSMPSARSSPGPRICRNTRAPCACSSTWSLPKSTACSICGSTSCCAS